MVTGQTRHGLSLNQPAAYRITVPGELDQHWSGWDGEMEIEVQREGENYPVSTLTVKVDQAALHGLLRRLYALGLPLISVRWIESS
jgi:hypothetical protein